MIMSKGEKTARFVVDRREGGTLVLLNDRDESLDVPAKALPSACRQEGAVLDVPLGPNDVPVWKKAVRNRIEEARRLRDAEKQLDRLRRTDPGGDVTL